MRRFRLLHTLAVALCCGLIVTSSASAYPWPVKPFDQQHPVRGYFGDPRTLFDSSLDSEDCSCSFHNGVDIQAPEGTPVYPVESGQLIIINGADLGVRTAAKAYFKYMHVTTNPELRTHQRVIAKKTLLGWTQRADHLHLTELDRHVVVNPLARGHLAPYVDDTTPVISGIDVSGGIIGVKAYDTPAMAVTEPQVWSDLPVTPALITFGVRRWNKWLIPLGTIAWDVRRTLPLNTQFWDSYMLGSYQNKPVIGRRYGGNLAGKYIFQLNHRQLPTGQYELYVHVSDTAGNSTTFNKIISYTAA